MTMGKGLHDKYKNKQAMNISASVAAAWYANLGQGTQGFNFHSAYANAKAAVSQRLGNSTSVGQLAVNQSPFYNWLKDNSLNKGIL